MEKEKEGTNITTIYLAGGEVETLTHALIDNGVTNILYSYYYIREMRKERFLQKIQEQNRNVSFVLDSGAFTYAMKFQHEPERLMPWRQYKQRFYQYIEEYGAAYSRIFEFDIDNTLEDVTMDMVDDWREEMLERWPHLNITPVWHAWRGTEAWTLYCRDKRIRTLALGRVSGGPGEHRKMIMEARRWGKPVHGLAMTRMNTTAKIVPYDSVDSTSWVMGQKYGTTYIFRANKFTTLAKDAGGKEKRKLFKSYYKAIGCDPDKVINDDVAELRKANIIAWRNLSARFVEMRKRQKMTIHEGVPEGFYPDDAKPFPEERTTPPTDKVVTSLFGRPVDADERPSDDRTINAWRTHAPEQREWPKERPRELSGEYPGIRPRDSQGDNGDSKRDAAYVGTYPLPRDSGDSGDETID